MMCNDHNLDLVNINAFTKFGEILPSCSQVIERKRNYYVNEIRKFRTVYCGTACLERKSGEKIQIQ